ncbi:MAG: DUF3160 domain-containing protein, partial [Polyangia bacterium]
ARPAPGNTVSPVPSPEETAERERISSALAAVADLDKAGLEARYPAVFAPALGYDPRSAKNLDLIRASKVGLSAREEEILGRQGFAISDRQRFPTFTYGYASIYADHLPLFVSADSLLYAVHRSYDEMLKRLETTSLRPKLSSMLAGMRTSLKSGTLAPLGPQTVKDVDLYLAVALALLDGSAPAPVAGASSTEIAALVAKANAMSGAQEVSLFGLPREEDFSQYTPRGHYTDTPELTSYFKAMMWLGRTDLRLIETQSDGSQLFRRRQFDGALGLASLVAGSLADTFTTLDSAIAAFVGESDNMRVTDFPTLLSRLGVGELAAVSALDDDTIATALVAGNFGAQRISSHIMINGMAKGTLPLSRTFLLLGQRYVVDSHVFSNVVYDRAGQGTVWRMMPNPLDVAFAALGNNQARLLLGQELDRFSYAPDLAAMRVLVDEHGADFWDANLYNGWLGALRSLSRAGAGQTPPLEVAGTEAWGRRILNTQLASWAELRHDTILYAKQSYTAGPACEFPDALVEPNPDFFGRLQAFATKGQQVTASLGLAAEGDYFVHLGTVAGMLMEMAQYQAEGMPFTTTHLAFINETVAVQTFCGGARAMGWYPKLFFGVGANSTEFAPTIADVHTQPKDERGNDVGRVLHVGTGYARMMVVTANTCTGPRAYVGLASSYFEEITERYKRLDDLTWTARFGSKGAFGWNDNGFTPAADVPWMLDLIGR